MPTSRRTPTLAVSLAAVLTALSAPLVGGPASAATADDAPGPVVRWVVTDRTVDPTEHDATRTVLAPADTTRAEFAQKYPGRVVQRDTLDTAATLPSTPTDGYLPQQWSLAAPSAATAGANVTTAWGTATGQGVTVAVVDTGIRTESGEFAGRVWPGYDFVSDPSMSNDGDGRDADPSDPGDYTADEDSSWHGTHVAGLALAGANNGGMVGVAPDAMLLPVRVLGAGGGYGSDIADGIVWAVGGHIAGVPDNAHPAQVVNVSIGGTGLCGAGYQAAIDYARSRGAIVVVAAGNESVDVSQSRPANCTGVIAVAATGRYGELASYSNYGAGVTIAAPGGDDRYIRTTADVPRFMMLSVVDQSIGAASGVPVYAAAEGTSMAAPMVAGALALAVERHPGLTTSSAATLLRSTATAFPTAPSSPAYDCRVRLCGGGVLNVAGLLQTAPAKTVPGAPSGLSATGVADGLSLAWQWPDDGGSAIQDFAVQYTTNGVDWTTVAHPPLTVGSYALTGLAPGTVYQVRIAAVNAIGTGAWSPVVSGTVPATAPGAPTITGTAAAQTSLTVSWAPGAANGAAITDYVLQYTADGTTWISWPHAATTATAATITGLKPATGYWLRLADVNALGQGGLSAPVSAVTAPTLPGAPGRLAAKALSASSVRVTWTVPNTGGAPLRNFVLQVAGPTGGWRTLSHSPTPATSGTVSKLAPGTAYRFRVAVETVAGRSPWSATLTTRTPQPTAFSAVASSARKPVARKAKVTVSAHLAYRTGKTAHAAARTWVYVDFDPAGAAPSTAVAKVRTDAKGNVRYAFRATTTGTLRFRAVGGGAIAPVSSAALTVRVR